MARIGLDKTAVREARNGLLAQSLYPSVDAVRVALGNTGSKTTIHKYLKELDEEEGSGKGSISDALQDLVGRLAARLQEEADGRLAVAVAQYVEKEQRHLAAEERMRQELSEALRRHELQNQQAQTDIRKLQQASAAAQVEATRLNQDNAKLVADLAHARLAAYDAQRVAREQNAKIDLLNARVRELELELASVRALADGQQGLAAELRNMLNERGGIAKPAKARKQ